ncbi:hypothetical protein B0H10DRAFT_1032405 [Mycena sp. CBHHK59/15]|nr:hypothetical protein B0H10DRAFT_1032405 [Mycena sp. CBHHK59/15]
MLGRSFAKALAPPSVSGGMMPLLTRRGLVDITAVEVLCDPGRHYGCQRRVVAQYGLLGEWGEMPRGVLPEVADPRMMARVARVQAFAKERGEQELAAAYAKAALQKQGRENALDLVSDRMRYYY